jgi:hypothetical protein
VGDLSKEVLPVGESTNHETIREHLQAIAERMQVEMGEQRPCDTFARPQNTEDEQPLPDGPMTVGIDGGYVRAAHKQGWFEVIAGRSVVVFRRWKMRFRRKNVSASSRPLTRNDAGTLWEVMKYQGMQENQQVVFMSDGGEDVRRVQAYLRPKQ